MSPFGCLRGRFYSYLVTPQLKPTVMRLNAEFQPCRYLYMEKAKMRRERVAFFESLTHFSPLLQRSRSSVYCHCSHVCGNSKQHRRSHRIPYHLLRSVRLSRPSGQLLQQIQSKTTPPPRWPHSRARRSRLGPRNGNPRAVVPDKTDSELEMVGYNGGCAGTGQDQ